MMRLFDSFNKKKPQHTPRLLQEEIELKEKLKNQDEQLIAINKAESTYKETGDIGSLISFWEGLWSSSGLIFNGSKWTFRLPELYMMTEQYDDAIKILEKIKNPSYAERKNSLLEKAKNLKSRSAK
jgi:tetratricopeptide (TPR) repeat protein